MVEQVNLQYQEKVCSLIVTDSESFGNTFKINLKTSAGTIASSQFTADNTGKVNIGSQVPNNIFQVGDGGKLRIWSVLIRRGVSVKVYFII